MVIGIGTITPALDGLTVDVTLTGLVVGTRYDVYRLQLRYLGDDVDTGAPLYERDLPDNKAYWSAVAHRVAWQAPAGPWTFRDYEPLTRPFSYFLVETSAVGPFDYSWASGDYPTSRGVLSPTVIHFNRDADVALGLGSAGGGGVVVRSTSELGLWVAACVYDFDTRYVARGTELAVLGRRYPMYVADTREARRGTLVLKTDTQGQYEDLRRIVFPQDGRIRPVILNSGGDSTLLLDDARVIPLDVRIEQATHQNAAVRFVTIDYVEVDPSAPLLVRTGDNDNLVNPPKATFTVSDATPNRNQTVTLTSTSTGQFAKFDWTIGRGSENKPSKFYGPGPYKVRWSSAGRRQVKLRVYGAPGIGASTATKILTVGGG
jgi:hypothetical protein